MTNKINGVEYGLPPETQSDPVDVVAALADTLIKGVTKLLPHAQLDIDRFGNIESAIVRIFNNRPINDTAEKLGATLNVMAYAIAQSMVGQNRGYPEFNDHPVGFQSGEDAFRAKFIQSPMFEQLGLKVGLNKRAFSNFKCPVSRYPEGQPLVDWLFSQYVYTAALYGGVDEEMSKLMCEQWRAVRWDWLHCDPTIAVTDFKRFRNRNR